MTLTMRSYWEDMKFNPGQLFIDGEWRDASDGGTWTHVSPVTNEEITSFAVGSAEDVDRAVKAARRAFDEGPWPGMKARDRKAILQRLVGLIYDNADELNRLQTLDNGMPYSFSSMYQLSGQFAADIFDHHAGWVDKITGETLPTFAGSDVQFMTFREPVGVVAAIIPWNAPLMLFAQKVAPALATGCTVVLKPSEYAALTAIRLSAIMEEAGLPQGVFNLVPGPGPTTGEALITHPGIDKVTFTGSRGVGGHILEASGRGIKRVSLELGGKSPGITFSDAQSIDIAAMTAMGNVAIGLSGQGCVCQTRALVDHAIYDEFVDKAMGLTAMVNFGDPFSDTTTSGPIINPRQLDRVMGFIDRANEDGARLVCGGDRPGGELANGNFVNPTLFADVDNDMNLAREEVFGPVLAVIPFRDEDDAIRLANDTDYGLGAGIYTSSVSRALRVARAVRAGTIGINEFTVMPNAPFGGFKTSGLGREGGWGSIEAFSEVKTVVIGLSG